MQVQDNQKKQQQMSPWRESIKEVIFGSETKLGKLFDIVLIISIIFSVVVVMLGSVDKLQLQYREQFFLFGMVFYSLIYIGVWLEVGCSAKTWVIRQKFFWCC